MEEGGVSLGSCRIKRLHMTLLDLHCSAADVVVVRTDQILHVLYDEMYFYAHPKMGAM
jgi:hypothetical protein